MIAFSLEGVVVFIFNLPAGASGTGDLQRVARGDFVVCCKGVLVGLLALDPDDMLDPVHAQCVFIVDERDIVSEPQDVGFPFAVVSDALGLRVDADIWLEQFDPFVELFVGGRLADEDEMVSVQQNLAAEGLVRIEVVAEQGIVARAVELAVARKPALGRLDFAILLLVAVLRGNEFGAQRDRLVAAGCDDDGRDGAVAIRDGSVLVLFFRAVVGVDRSRGMLSCPVDGDELGAIHAPEILKHSLLSECAQDGIIDGEEFPGFDRVEQVPDLVGRGDLSDVEKGLGIAAPLPLLHGLLGGEKGWTLHEKHREGGQPGILHRILRIASRSVVG